MGVTFAPPPQQVEDVGERASPWTVIASIWATATFIWGLFTPPQYTFATRVMLLQPLWVVRILLDDEDWVNDLYIFLVLHAGFTLWTGAWTLPNIPALIFATDAATLMTYLKLFSALGGFAILAAGIVYREKQVQADQNEGFGSIKTIEENPLPPLLIPSRTTHSRFFPKKHSFSYSYLFVGVPVGIRGKFGKALSVDTDKQAWFHVDAADHLSRSTSKKTLSEKLTAFLHSQGVKESEYEFAYLVTAPRFLGYNFNPVSFWYLYDDELTLRYMIPEVNNTFGERRIYLLKPSTQPDPQLDEDGHSSNCHAGKALTFTQTWAKDFHVSPFNSRKGSYSIRTIDPLAVSSEGKPRFDTTIVLRSPNNETKIVARVFSEAQSVHPESVSTSGLLKFIASWWWVGLMTLPRILWEARKLYFAKALNLYFRPEVTAISIGREYTLDEEKIESFFRLWITQVAEEAKAPLRLIYEPPHAPNEIVTYSSAFSHAEDRKQTLTLKVITPAFYSRFVHYAHAQEAFDRECLATDDRNRTAIIEPAHLMPVLLDAINYRQQRVTRVPTTEGLRWRLMRWLRCPPAQASFTDKALQPGHEVEDIRRFGSSELDTYVRLRCDEPDIFRRSVTTLFLAQRLCLGVPLILTALDILSRGILILVAVAYINNSGCFDILRRRPLTKDDAFSAAMVLLAANGVHLWSLSKG